jgi:hypothetical protein
VVRPIVETQRRDGEDMWRPVVEDERVLEGDPDDRPSLGPEPARGGQIRRVELVERRGDVAAARLDGDRFRYPC